MSHFELGNITITPEAQEILNQFSIDSANILQKHLLQNFEPMPEYSLLKDDQMYMTDMDKNAQVISRKHGRVFSYMRFEETVVYIFTSLRIGRSEGTLICLPHGET